MDVVGRLLGEMKATPIGGGRNLLDDTLVVIFSQFGRTAAKSGTCDHYPANSTVFVGGGIEPNRMVGGFTLEGMSTLGPLGRPIKIVDKDGVSSTRPPKSADVIETILAIMGITNVFIQGGHGEAVGIRSV